MFFILIGIVVTIIIAIWNSKIEIKIKDLDISTARKEKVNKNYKLHINIIIFNKIKVFGRDIKKLEFKNKNLNRLYNTLKTQEERVNAKNAFAILTEAIKNLEIETKQLDLKIEIGTQDAAISAILVGIISSILGVILRNQTSKHSRFEVIPLYIDKEVLNLKFNGIFRINLIHYIYKNILKGRENNERKSSYRRSYAHNNE